MTKRKREGDIVIVPTFMFVALDGGGGGSGGLRIRKANIISSPSASLNTHGSA